MKRIQKQPLPLLPRQTLALPIDAKILTVQVCLGQPYLYILVDDLFDFDSKAEDDPPTKSIAWQKKEINIYQEGHYIENNADEYIGSFQLNNHVFHVFAK